MSLRSSRSPRRPLSPRIWPVVLLASLLVSPGRPIAQVPANSPHIAAVSAAEATAIARGLTALAQNDLAEADAVARQALRDYPRSPAAVTLAVEVGIARAGAGAALTAYEQWLSARQVEHPYALRRIARSLLYEELASSSDPTARAEAAAALHDDGEVDVERILRLNLARGLGVDRQPLAAIGAEDAIAQVVTVLETGAGDRVNAINALAASRSEHAVAPLVQALKSPRAEVRAAAATGLGVLEAKEAIPALRELLKDLNLPPRMAAAGSLYRLRDMSGYAMLQTWYSSDVGGVRLDALRATAGNPDAVWVNVARGLTSDADPMVQIGAAHLLGPHDPGTAYATLRRLANDPNQAVQQAAWRAMPAAIGGDFGALRAYMRAADPVVRVRAAARMFQMTR
jgi:HEAT repeat protein